MKKSFKRDLVFITHGKKINYLLLSLQMHNLFLFFFFVCLVYIIQTDLGYEVSFIGRRVTCYFCPSTS
jgi:hypothetical protein